jgi:hypothetical protein
MRELIAQRKAPQGATVPEKVEMTGLFALVVDDAIWQDVGLADEDLMDPPIWMCNDDVRRGIKALLEIDRCMEEEARLVHERRALQVWFSEEWKIVMEGCQVTGACYYILTLVDLVIKSYMSFIESDCLRYQLELRKQDLCKLYVIWQKHLVGIKAGDHPLPPWGPSQNEILEAGVAAVTASWEEVDSDEESADEGDIVDDEWETGFFETLDAVDRADAYCEVFQ